MLPCSQLCHAQCCGMRRPSSKAEVSAVALHQPRVEQWVDRELRALLLDSDVSIVAQHIQGSLSAAFPRAEQRCASSRSQTPRLPPLQLPLAPCRAREPCAASYIPQGPGTQAWCVVMQCINSFNVLPHSPQSITMKCSSFLAKGGIMCCPPVLMM